MTKRRRLTSEELSLWQRFTAGVERLHKNSDQVESKPPGSAGLKRGAVSAKAQSSATSRQRTPSPASALKSPDLDPTRPVNTDRRTWERLKRGQIAIESRLDLHGRTQTEAHHALDRFLASSAASGYRCVLIVTGKGVDGHGVLRQMVPRWLAEENNRQKVITYCTAHSRHGGAGALYVLIRRSRARDNRR